MPAGQSIVDEVEAAISAGSATKRLETARRVTELFLASAGSFNSEQVELFDTVLARRYPSVSRRIVGNPGARVSADSFAIIVAQAETNPELAVEAGIRVDLPSELRRRLLSSATEAVRTQLLSRAPPHLFEEI